MKPKRRRLAGLLATVALLASIGCGPRIEIQVPPRDVHTPPPRAGTRVLRIACVDHNVLRAARQVIPLLEHASRRSGIGLDMHYFETYEAALTALREGVVELAWLSPTTFVEAARTGAVPVCRPVLDGRDRYRSLLVSRAGSTITTSTDLRGARVAFVRPESTSGHLIPRAHLDALGLVPERDFAAISFAGDEYRALDGVARGLYDAAFVQDGIIESSQRDIDPAGYRVVAPIASIPHGPIVARPDLPTDDLRRLGEAFIGLDRDPEASRLLEGTRKTSRIESFVPARVEDYREVEGHLPAEDTRE